LRKRAIGLPARLEGVFTIGADSIGAMGTFASVLFKILLFHWGGDALFIYASNTGCDHRQYSYRLYISLFIALYTVNHKKAAVHL